MKLNIISVFRKTNFKYLLVVIILGSCILSLKAQINQPKLSSFYNNNGQLKLDTNYSISKKQLKQMKNWDELIMSSLINNVMNANFNGNDLCSICYERNLRLQSILSFEIDQNGEISNLHCENRNSIRREHLKILSLNTIIIPDSEELGRYYLPIIFDWSYYIRDTLIFHPKITDSAFVIGYNYIAGDYYELLPEGKEIAKFIEENPKNLLSGKIIPDTIYQFWEYRCAQRKDLIKLRRFLFWRFVIDKNNTHYYTVIDGSNKDNSKLKKAYKVIPKNGFQPRFNECGGCISFHYVLAVKDKQIIMINEYESFKKFLGTIDNQYEAHQLLIARFTDMKQITGFQEVDNGYICYGTKIDYRVSSSEHECYDLYKILITKDGYIKRTRVGRYE